MTKILSYQIRVDEETGKLYRGSLREIENTLDAKQKFVNFGRAGGLIQVVSLGDIDLILHDEGKILQYPPNRAILDDDGEVLDVIVGNILAVRHNSEGDFTSILPSDVEVLDKYLKPVHKKGTHLMIVPTEKWLEEANIDE
jgi:hypothetical protein